MNRPRWRILLPVAILLTLSIPTLRALPGGMWWPDPWLLLMLWAVPAVPGASLRFPISVVLAFGLLRASVSAVPLSLCWAGLGLALSLRFALHRFLSEEHFLLRWLTASAAAVPLELLDFLYARSIGLSLAWSEAALRIALVGGLWALAHKPARWSFRQGSASG